MTNNETKYKLIRAIPTGWNGGGKIISYVVKMKYNSLSIGHFIQDVDGFFYFQREPAEPGTKGYWSSEVLLDLGNYLKELNAKWQTEIDKISN